MKITIEKTFRCFYVIPKLSETTNTVEETKRTEEVERRVLASEKKKSKQKRLGNRSYVTHTVHTHERRPHEADCNCTEKFYCAFVSVRATFCRSFWRLSRPRYHSDWPSFRRQLLSSSFKNLKPC